MPSKRIRGEKVKKVKGGTFFVVGHFPIEIVPKERQQELLVSWLDEKENVAAPPDAKPRLIYPIGSVETGKLARAIVKLCDEKFGYPPVRPGAKSDPMRRVIWFRAENAGRIELAKRLQFEVALKNMAAIARRKKDDYVFDDVYIPAAVRQWEDFLYCMYSFGQKLQEAAERAGLAHTIEELQVSGEGKETLAAHSSTGDTEGGNAEQETEVEAEVAAATQTVSAGTKARPGTQRMKQGQPEVAQAVPELLPERRRRGATLRQAAEILYAESHDAETVALALDRWRKKRVPKPQCIGRSKADRRAGLHDCAALAGYVGKVAEHMVVTESVLRERLEYLAEEPAD